MPSKYPVSSKSTSLTVGFVFLLLFVGVGSVLKVSGYFGRFFDFSLAFGLAIPFLISIYIVSERGALPRSIVGFVVFMAVFAAWNAVLAAGYSQPHGLERAGLAVGIIGIVLFFARHAGSVGPVGRRCFVGVAYLILVGLGLWSVMKAGHGVEIINENGPGAISFALAGFIVTFANTERRGAFHLIMSLFLAGLIAWQFSSRAAFFSLIIFGMAYTWFGYFRKLSLASWAPLTAVFVIQLIFVFLYSNQGGVQQVINSISMEISGQRAMSGRDEMWPLVLSAIQDSMWFGYGPGSSVSDLFVQNLSAHNLFLQVAYQTGLVGVFFLFGALLYLHYALVRSRSEIQRRAGAAFLPAVLFLNIFGVSLTQNMFAYGAMYWAVLGSNLRYK